MEEQEIKNRQDFLRELEKGFFEDDGYRDFPFKSIFIENHSFKEMLFNEFTKTERIPSLYLFLNQYPKEVIDKEQDEQCNRVPVSTSRASNTAANTIEPSQFFSRIKSEYSSLLIKGELPQIFYSHTLKKTETYKILSEIDKQLIALKSDIINPKNGEIEGKDVYKENKEIININQKQVTTLDFTQVEGIAYNIVSRLSEINNIGLKSKVVEAILKDIKDNDSDIFYYYIHKGNTRYNAIKRHFMMIFSKYHQELMNENKAESQIIDNDKKKPKQPITKKDKSAISKVNIFEGIFKVRKNVKDSLHEFESKEFKGFSKRTLERAIKIKYNDCDLTFESYVKRYLTDNLTDKN